MEKKITLKLTALDKAVITDLLMMTLYEVTQQETIQMVNEPNHLAVLITWRWFDKKRERMSSQKKSKMRVTYTDAVGLYQFLKSCRLNRDSHSDPIRNELINQIYRQL